MRRLATLVTVTLVFCFPAGRADAMCPPEPLWAVNGCKTVISFPRECPVFYGCRW